MDEIEDVPRVPAQAIKLDDDKDVARANEVEDRRKLIATVSGASRDYLGSYERAAGGLELGFLGSRVLSSGGDAGVANQVTLAASGSGSAGAPYLSALKALSTPQGFISEQVFSPPVTLPGDIDDSSGWVVAGPPGQTAGSTGSMEPPNWAQGEYINLLADIAANKVLDIPQAVCSRYHACVLPPGPGQVEVDLNVDAITGWGQYMYVTGNTGALGNWNTNLGLPVDSSSYPVWKNSINLAAGGAIQYTYYRKNPDGSVTWECYPGNGDCSGNRSLTLPSSGQVPLVNNVSWN